MKNDQYVIATMVSIIWGLIFWGSISVMGINMLVAAVVIPFFAWLFSTLTIQVIDQKLTTIRIYNLQKYNH
ncbi:MAG: hypothetical protein KQI35_17405 [Bacteroidetes bacterium]|nr:hypothetical protein [Bacteroidota bacterium]